ncbi:unnamed protein product [Discosporangium mesarthrocarpum]
MTSKFAYSHGRRQASLLFVGTFPKNRTVYNSGTERVFSGTRICMMVEEWMRDTLQRRRTAGMLRELRTSEADGCFVDFTSNDYLGLGRSEELLRAIQREDEDARKEAAQRQRRRPRASIARYPFSREEDEEQSISTMPIVGSGGSRLLSGNSRYAEELEMWIATFHNREAALIFNSGYDANLGLLSCLPGQGDAVVCDELVHNSMRMGCRLGRQSHTESFRHSDTGHLDTILCNLRGESQVSIGGNIFIAVESVYSMDGDLAPLAEIVEVAHTHGAAVIVDEAHGTGVFGHEGRGVVHSLGLESHPALLATVHTFGKALGVHGAAVVGSKTLKDYLINYARPLIYSTSLPFHSLASIRCAYLLQAKADKQRAHILNLADKFHSALSSDSVPACGSWKPAGVVQMAGVRGGPPLPPHALPHRHSPIQSVQMPGNERVSAVASGLRGLGFDVRAIRAPTVPAGTERLRVTLHAYNTTAEVISLACHIRFLARVPEASRSDSAAPGLKLVPCRESVESNFVPPAGASDQLAGLGQTLMHKVNPGGGIVSRL